jgi:HSP20 family molecular chaperone IbpA
MSEKATATQMATESSFLKLVEPQTLSDRTNRIHNAIARRAFELFEGDGGLFGRDLEHWLQAEAELLHPVHVQVAESNEAVQLQAEVPGFSPKELEVSVQPQRVIISGKKESNEEHKIGKIVYREQCSNEILRLIELPADVEASKTIATLKNGVLALRMPKGSQTKRTAEVDVRPE